MSRSLNKLLQEQGTITESWLGLWCGTEEIFFDFLEYQSKNNSDYRWEKDTTELLNSEWYILFDIQNVDKIYIFLIACYLIRILVICCILH